MFNPRNVNPRSLDRLVLILAAWCLAAAVTFTILVRRPEGGFVENYLSRLHRQSTSQSHEHEAHPMPRSHLDRG
ncbi:MAG: hypothetical protein COV75_05160 [Candidatus Omnitrophica bacterium CG11_big_fil_rev_8_21_14_0_20_63_9]|nr:MAG: hypothetical protein COV75_05160 [Candidatus Omnitrophica bacterium CG11_big_fil_rev_8_21_14_0_20_63_9]